MPKRHYYASIISLLIATAAGQAMASAPSTCKLGNGIEHVVVIAFDNLDSKRNSPNVPSDLEQLPSLSNFIVKNGVLLTNHWTQLPSFTNPGFHTISTGLYPDRHGVVGNDVGFFKPDDSSATASAFAYWTTKMGDVSSTVPAANNTYF